MSEYTLSIIDTTGVQNYIFGSNRLRENVGASQLVEMTTHEFLDQVLQKRELKLKHNRNPDQTALTIEGNALDVEVVLQGGGNAVFLSKDEPTAKILIRHLSRLLLERAPGLDIAAAHYTFTWESDPLGGPNGVYNKLLSKLSQAKQQRHSSAPVLGLGVTLECRSTGLPAIDFFRYGQNDMQTVSSDVLAKVEEDTAKAAKERLNGMFKDVTQGYEFRGDFDQLGGTEDESRYIAVVHADGNGIGKRFQEVIKVNGLPGDGNRECLIALQRLSHAVAEAGKTALQKTVQRLVETFKHIPDDASAETRKAWLAFIQSLIPEEKEKPILPLRPIVFGGDDVTFVCDGRLGLPLAAIYLHEWEQASKELLPGKPSYACAGVAVVKTHYPFVRAYNLSEQLCKQAKAAVKSTKKEASALDWHFAFSGIFGEIADIREREFTTLSGNLAMRPLMLSQAVLEPSWRTWPNFKHLVGTFTGDVLVNGKVYANRNKVKGLREALRGGERAVEQFCSTYRLNSLPTLDSNNTALQKTGWIAERCGYFDAIEALDFFLPLEMWVTE